MPPFREKTLLWLPKHNARAVTDHQAAAPPFARVGQLGYISVDLGLECGSEHPPGTLPDDLINQRRPAAGSGAVGSSTDMPSRLTLHVGLAR
jgi:hypothetical protein